MKGFTFFTPPPVEKALEDLKTNPVSYVERLGERMALSLFQYASQTVPAYQTLLRKHNIESTSIRTIEDFKYLPVINKDSYLKKYEYADLFPDRDFSRVTTISATSGSSGEPFYFPRGEEQDLQYEYVAEIFLRNQFEIDKKRTLAVLGFGLGIWIGGIISYRMLNRISAKGYNLAVAPVGPDIELFLKVIKKFGQFFDQVLLMGYAPFIKDVVDEAVYHDIDWRDYNVKIFTAAESWSEKLRQYFVERTFLKNRFTDTLNLYGTVELLANGHETPLSNLIRKIAAEDEGVFRRIFPDARHLPTLGQYHPYLIYSEQVNGEVISTGYGASIPLIRYRFPDRGSVIPFNRMVEYLKDVGVDIEQEAVSAGIVHTIQGLPFVYIHERSDQAIVVRGANIYSEEIKQALQGGSLEDFVTTKFTMIKKEDERMNAYFEVNVELKKGVAGTEELKQRIQTIIVETLKKKNSEYNDQYRSVPAIMTPPVILWSYQDPTYFKSGGKQKWME